MTVSSTARERKSAFRAASGIPRGRVLELRQTAYPTLSYYAYMPWTAAIDAPMLVAVHGISRDAAEQIRLFRPCSDRYGAILVAPVFDEAHYGDYQRLGRRGRGLRADLALQAALSDFMQERGGSDVFLFGYSGGAQFVHRFVMAYPETVTAAVVAAAGWYTFPNPGVTYPYGLRVAGELPGVRMRPNEFLEVPILAIVGGNDVQRDRSLRRSRRLDREQGRNRVDRARRWVEEMAKAAGKGGQSACRFSMLEGVGHSFAECMQAGLGETVFDFLASQSVLGPRNR
jgi:poly(3-hydroxybutyrate) depolymerase